MGVNGYVTGEYIPTTVEFSPDGSTSLSAGYGTANEIVGDKLKWVCCRIGRNIVYGNDVSVKGWKSVYLKVTHPTSSEAKVTFNVEAVQNAEENTSEKTYILLYGPDSTGGLVDYRNAPVLPIYE